MKVDEFGYKKSSVHDWKGKIRGINMKKKFVVDVARLEWAVMSMGSSDFHEGKDAPAICDDCAGTFVDLINSLKFEIGYDHCDQEANLRPCEIYVGNGKTPALFHRWTKNYRIVPPSPMIGGHQGGNVSFTMALVELHNGGMMEVPVNAIKFREEPVDAEKMVRLEDAIEIARDIINDFDYGELTSLRETNYSELMDAVPERMKEEAVLAWPVEKEE